MLEKSLKPWILAARPRTLPLSVMPVVVGSALALQDGFFQPWPALACLAFSVLAQIGANWGNDYYDFIKGADTPSRVGPTRAVAAGLVTPAAMRNATYAVLALAFAIGCTLIPFGGWPLIVVGVASIVTALAYTAGPYPLGYHGLGDVAVIVFFGLIAAPFTYYVQAQSFCLPVWIAGLAIGLMINNVLVVASARDIQTDSKAGKHTLAVRFGKRFTEYQYAVSAYAAVALSWVLWGLGSHFLVVLPTVLLPLIWNQDSLFRRADIPVDYLHLLKGAARLVVLYGVLLSIGISIG
ncbi:MAG TPA: 1,4-dihydroxy-2-naphthoate polyprenyltransferase [Opitutales bacterium]|nr:1,4-dihydroxy-2-naphthoate polyprenyltransferase [Opitutales bacterium]